MTDVPEWVTSVPNTPAVHDTPQGGYQWSQVSQEQVSSLRRNLIQSVISAVVEIISGFLPFTRPAAEFLGGIFNDLFGLLGNPTGLGSGNPKLGPLANIPILGPILSALTNPGAVVVNAFNLIGNIAARLLGRVPVGQLSQEKVNLVDDPTFPAGSIGEASAGWWVNLAFSVTSDGTGVAEITADGTSHMLITGDKPTDRMAVGEGQVVAGLIHVMHDTVVTSGSGAPVILWLLRFNDAGQELTPIALASYSPVMNTVNIPGVQITGKYKIPAGVVEAQLAVEVTEAARAGVWRFDNARFAAEADITMFTGVQAALQAVDAKGDEILKGIASVAKGVPILDKIGVDDAMLALASWQPGMVLGVIGNILSLATGALLRRPMPNASAQDFANALAQSYNIPGVDEVSYIPYSATPITGTIPAFADKWDVIGLGGGQDGLDGFLLMWGQGGAAGKFAATTWEDGVHYTKGVTTYTVTFNSDRSVTISVPGHSITADEGSGPRLHDPLGFLGHWYGKAPTQIEYNDRPYQGGGTQTGMGGPGISPGGGGGGGRGIIIPKGGRGGDPAAWARFYADSVVIENPSTGTDGSPPTVPTIFEVVDVTHNKIRVKVGGSTDV